jgi:hypothetical protein
MLQSPASAKGPPARVTCNNQLLPEEEQVLPEEEQHPEQQVQVDCILSWYTGPMHAMQHSAFNSSQHIDNTWAHQETTPKHMNEPPPQHTSLL